MASRLKTFLCLILLILMAFNQAGASHMIGAEISYTALGNDRYLIVVKAYRDCNGITMSNTPILVIPQNCSASAFTKTLVQISVRDITPICSTATSKCSGGTYQYGIEEYLYRDTLNLSAYTSCCTFHVSWEQQARSSAIGTGPADQNFYIATKINKCITNSTPVFSGNIPILCAGQDFCYNIGATDPVDNDSLSFSLDSALQAMNTPVSYSTGYSYKRPLMFLGSPNNNAPLPAGLHMDSLSGDLCFRPTKVQIGVIVIKVTEWRKINGIVTNVGETRRDMEVIVTTCAANKVPQLAGGPSAFQACSGQNICFDINSSDLDALDTVILSWNQGIPGASFTTSYPSGSKKQKATFCWTPTDADTIGNPHIFSVTARDNGCPINGRTSRAYQISVKPNTTVTASRQISKPGCGNVSFDATLSRSGAFLYSWTIKNSSGTLATANQKAFNYTFHDPGQYIINFSVGDSFNCPVKYTDTLQVDNFVNVQLPHDTAICKGHSLSIIPAVTLNNGPVSYQWSTGVNDTLSSLNILMDNTIKIHVTVSDSVCSSTDTILISRRIPGPINAGSDFSMCIYNGTKTLSATPAGGTWSGVGVSGNIFDPLVSGPGIFYPVYTYTDITGCEGADSAKYTVYPVPVVNAGNDTSICSNSSMSLIGMPQGGSWTGPGIFAYTFTPGSSSSGNHTLIYSYTNAGGCKATDTLVINVITAPVVNAGPDTAMCTNGSIVTLQGIPAGGTWFGAGVTGNTFNPSGISGQVTIFYRYFNGGGCSSTDSRIIKINALSFVFAGNNQSMCKEYAPVTLLGIPSGGTWFGNGMSGNQFNPAVAGKGIHTLTYQVTDGNGCINADFIQINVDNPTAAFTASPDSGAVPLTVSFNDISPGPHSSSWDFGDPASGANSSNLKSPSHIYYYSAVYTVRLAIRDSSGNHCLDTLTKVNHIYVSVPNGTVQLLNEKGIQVYPNPASGSFDILLRLNESSDLTLTITDIRGAKVKQLMNLAPGILHVDCHDICPGMYFIEVSGRSGEVYKTKIILE